MLGTLVLMVCDNHDSYQWQLSLHTRRYIYMHTHTQVKNVYVQFLYHCYIDTGEENLASHIYGKLHVAYMYTSRAKLSRSPLVQLCVELEATLADL